MSNSLTINTPNIVQQNTPLRNVPSGSTAEPDYNVKYVPQDLTEAQKAQARQNIGAAAEGEGGGATINEFHYLRDTTTDPATYYIDADGYEPQEGDLMTIVWDWPFRTDENDEAAFKNPATLKNNSTNPSIYIKNAHQMATDYDEIDPEVNTRWTVRLEKVDNVWYAYNISTAVQADWNTLDTKAPSYIKNKPNIDTKYFCDCMNMYNTMTVFTTHGGTSVYPNSGGELGNVKDIIIGEQNLNGLTMYDTPRNTSGCGIYRTTWIIDPQKMQYNGYWRFYPGSEMEDLWMYPGINDNTQKGRIDNPIHEIWCKDVNIVLRGTHGAYNNYKRINRIKQNLQLVTKFTVWNTTNTGWQGLWDGTGDVVLFDTEMEKFVEAVNAPNALIGFKIYMPKSRYTEFVAAMTAAWGSTAVNDYILPKVEQYDFVYSEGFKYKMVNSVPLTMTDANGDTISGDFVANNVTITPAV